jgi:hypothetical protein
MDSLRALPFFCIDDNLLRELQCTDHDIKSRLNEFGLREYLSGLNVNSIDKINANYYSVERFNSTFQKSNASSELSVFHLNIRSLNCNNRGLVSFLAEIDRKFDVIVVSEPWSINLNFYANLFGINSYEFYYDLPNNSKVGGVAVYVKKSLQCKLRKDLFIKFNPEYKCENLWFEICKCNKNFLIAAIYRHPNQNCKKFFELLEPNLNMISNSKTTCLVLGDINLDLVKYNVDSVTKLYIDNLVGYNFLPLLTLPTRVTTSTCTLIDHIYFHEPFNGKGNNQQIFVGNFLSDLTDHFSNFVILKLHDKKVKFRPLIRVFNENNNQHFHDRIANVNWNDLFYNAIDVNEAFTSFNSVVHNCFNSSFPLVKMSKRVSKDKVWVTPGIKSASHTKNSLYKKWLITKCEDDKLRYLEYKRIYSRLIKKAEKDFYREKFNKRLNDSKSIWNQINKLCSYKTCKSKNSVNKLKENGQIITDKVQISNAFNKFFSEVGSSLACQLSLPKDPLNNFKKYLGSPTPNTFYCDKIYEYEVGSVILSMKRKKSCGPDGLPICIFKNHSDLLIGPLTFLFNFSLEAGVVPDSLKLAKVIPIFKKGDVDLATNYRPISLLNVSIKIFEKVLANRLMNFFDKYKMFYDYQFGFRKRHSTSLALVEVIDDCYKLLDEDNYVAGMYFDLQKAFDSVDHAILLKKLYHYGIRGNIHKWFASYLDRRKQFTLVNDIASSVTTLSHGVPQGSVLGPLLFLIFVNDMPNAIQDNRVRLFADDTNLFIHAKSLTLLEATANECVEALNQWFCYNKLSVNISKTCYTLFKLKQGVGNEVITVKLNDVPIEQVKNCKYLGVLIDEHLNWNDHIDCVYNKIVKFTSIFFKLRVLLPPYALRNLYFAVVFPHILYGIEVYGSAAAYRLDRLVKLNNKILRTLQWKKLDYPIKDLYSGFNTLPVPLLHQYQLLVFMFKYSHCNSSLPPALQNYFITNSSIHDHNTRARNNLHLFSVSTVLGSKTLSHNGSKLWNTLPDQLKNIKSLSLFCNKTKRYLLENFLT